jgi:hypothetical protein
MPPGLAAFLNVSGMNADSDDTYETQFGAKSYKPETPPIPLFNNSDKQIIRSFVVPLKHNTTEFFLGTAARPEEPDSYVRLKGGVTISAIAATCLGTHKAKSSRPS